MNGVRNVGFTKVIAVYRIRWFRNVLDAPVHYMHRARLEKSWRR